MVVLVSKNFSQDVVKCDVSSGCSDSDKLVNFFPVCENKEYLFWELYKLIRCKDSLKLNRRIIELVKDGYFEKVRIENNKLIKVKSGKFFLNL